MRTPVAALVLSILAAAPALAQVGSSTIVGRVTSGGRPLDRAGVTIDSDAIQSVRVTKTTSRGTYWAAVLPAGTYRITFSHAGTQTVTRKAEVRIGETVRVDADLAPSEEGESVTMTTIRRSILERPVILTSVESDLVDQLPVARELSSRIALAPGVFGTGIRGSAENLYVVDGVYLRRRGADVEIEDAIADAAVIATTVSGEFGHFAGGTVLVSTKTGGNELTASLRGTFSSATWRSGPPAGKIKSRYEATAGGKIVRDALWFFLAGADGAQSVVGGEKVVSAKLTATPAPRVTFGGSVLRASQPDETRASGDGLVIASRRAVIDGHADTSRIGSSRDHHESLSVHTLVPTRFGDHAFVAGGETYDDRRSLYAGNSWSDGVRVVVSASARWDEDLGLSPRAGVAWDLHADGSARISASWGRYAGSTEAVREGVLAFSRRVLTSGFFRAAVVRRKFDSGRSYDAFEVEGRTDYLFLTVGGAASINNGAHSGVLWIVAIPPALEQHFTLSLAERYRDGAATDISLQYRLTRGRIEPFVKTDFLNVFDRKLPVSEDALGGRRALRISVGARL